MVTSHDHYGTIRSNNCLLNLFINCIFKRILIIEMRNSMSFIFNETIKNRLTL